MVLLNVSTPSYVWVGMMSRSFSELGNKLRPGAENISQIYSLKKGGKGEDSEIETFEWCPIPLSEHLNLQGLHYNMSLSCNTRQPLRVRKRKSISNSVAESSCRNDAIEMRRGERASQIVLSKMARPRKTWMYAHEIQIEHEWHVFTKSICHGLSR